MSFVTIEGPLTNWIESSISPILPKNKYITVLEDDGNIKAIHNRLIRCF